MDIKILKYFIAVAEEKTISKAAQKLYISQPALSKQLKELENELDLQLFERGSRNIKLTEDGAFLLTQANEIVELMDKTLNNLNKNKEVNGEIYIGSGETKGVETIIPTINRVLTDYKNVTFDFYSGNANEIMEKIDESLDF